MTETRLQWPRGRRAALAVLALLAVAPRAGADPPPEPGVVVEAVTADGLGARAGLSPGDRLLSWCRSADAAAGACLAQGRIESPFDVVEMEDEQVPRGGVRLRGERGGKPIEWAPSPGPLAVEVGPVLPTELEQIYQEGRELASRGNAEAAADRWRAAAEKAPNPRLGLWFRFRAAGVLAQGPGREAADELYREAVARARGSGELRVAAKLLTTWCFSLADRDRWQAAREHCEEALGILDGIAPESLAAASPLNSLGTIAFDQGDLELAQEHLHRALAIRERLAPESLRRAQTLNNLGLVELQRGDLGASEKLLTQALKIKETLVPGSVDVAKTSLNLSDVAAKRGELAVAEDLLERARRIFAGHSHSQGLRSVLINLGHLAIQRADGEAAQSFYEEALKLDVPGELDALRILLGLGGVALANRHLDQAEEYFQRTLERARESLAPDHEITTEALYQLGEVALERGALQRAEPLLRQALAALRKSQPVSLDVGNALESLARLAGARGDFATAEDLYRQAFATWQRIGAAETFSAVQALFASGQGYRNRGLNDRARERFCAAADLADRLRPRLGGVEQSKTAFGSATEKVYVACLDSQIAAGRLQEAFAVQERGRARTFLEWLAERDLLFARDLPAELRRRRQEIDRAYDTESLALLERQASGDGGETAALEDRLRELARQRDELVVEIRRASPSYAALQYPQPLELAAARRALDPGTVLLSYALGEKRSYLLVVEPPETPGPGISAYPLAVEDEELRQEIAGFRALLARGPSDRRAARALREHARRLYRLLIQPAERQIGRARRLLLAPSGPLHSLPFAALLRGNQYLVEWKPLHSVLSATVYAEIKKRRTAGPSPSRPSLAAFGDPPRPFLSPGLAAGQGDPQLRAALRRGLDLSALPGSRNEVHGIAALFPGARAYLGAEATEERAKAVAPEVRVLHFATHGLFDPRFPLDSALVLALPEHPGEGKENGLLQAWEILEQIHLDADLVTLSACDTALGLEMGGEGMIGLTRAFQYAGARTVLASLWSVSDPSTAGLMQRFYRALRGGRSKDEALREAQRERIRAGGPLAAPYHWAAFQLAGDWR